jgi:hypothetical protein
MIIKISCRFLSVSFESVMSWYHDSDWNARKSKKLCATKQDPGYLAFDFVVYAFLVSSRQKIQLAPVSSQMLASH